MYRNNVLKNPARGTFLKMHLRLVPVHLASNRGNSCIQSVTVVSELNKSFLHSLKHWLQAVCVINLYVYA